MPVRVKTLRTGALPARRREADFLDLDVARGHHLALDRGAASGAGSGTRDLGQRRQAAQPGLHGRGVAIDERAEERVAAIGSGIAARLQPVLQALEHRRQHRDQALAVLRAAPWARRSTAGRPWCAAAPATRASLRPRSRCTRGERARPRCSSSMSRTAASGPTRAPPGGARLPPRPRRARDLLALALLDAGAPSARRSSASARLLLLDEGLDARDQRLEEGEVRVELARAPAAPRSRSARAWRRRALSASSRPIADSASRSSRRRAGCDFEEKKLLSSSATLSVGICRRPSSAFTIAGMCAILEDVVEEHRDDVDRHRVHGAERRALRAPP